MQYINLDKRFLTAKNEKLACDQYFCARDHQLYYLMEQKVRDDHDSTKKRRQIVNFRAKLVHLKVIHGKSLTGIMYFIDPALHKNTGYYQQEVIALRQELEIPIHLFYNGELFQFLQGHTETWDFLVNSLNFWRVSVPEKIELDYDADSSKTIAELTAISGSIWYKRITNDALWTSGVIASLFATGETLRHFEGVLRQKGEQRFQSGKDSITFQFLADLLKQRLLVYYPNVSL
jgi:hypothetical protein